MGKYQFEKELLLKLFKDHLGNKLFKGLKLDNLKTWHSKSAMKINVKSTSSYTWLRVRNYTLG